MDAEKYEVSSLLPLRHGRPTTRDTSRHVVVTTSDHVTTGVRGGMVKGLGGT